MGSLRVSAKAGLLWTAGRWRCSRLTSSGAWWAPPSRRRFCRRPSTPSSRPTGPGRRFVDSRPGQETKTEAWLNVNLDPSLQKVRYVENKGIQLVKKSHMAILVHRFGQLGIAKLIWNFWWNTVGVVPNCFAAFARKIPCFNASSGPTRSKAFSIIKGTLQYSIFLDASIKHRLTKIKLNCF